MRYPRLGPVFIAIALAAASGAAGASQRKPGDTPHATKSRSRAKTNKNGARSLPPLALTSAVVRPPVARSAGEDRTLDKTATQRKAARAKKAARPGRDRWPAMKLEAVNTKEKLTLRIYDRRGRTIRPAIRRLWHLMRCHVTNTERPIHWRLIRNMYKVARHYPGRTLYIYSGYRSPKVASLRSSNHVKGRAVDFRVAGITNRALRDYLMNNYKPCGVGYYPSAPFVHFDIREKQSAFWIDYSGKGEAAEYASNPFAVLKQEKAGATKREPVQAKPAAKPAPAAAPAPGADDPDSAPAAARGEGDGSQRSSKAAKPVEQESDGETDAPAEVPPPVGAVPL